MNSFKIIVISLICILSFLSFAADHDHKGHDQSFNNGGFEHGIFPWMISGFEPKSKHKPHSTEMLEIVTENVHSGEKACKVYDRTSPEQGPMQFITADLLKNGHGKYHINGWIRMETDSADVIISIDITDDDGEHSYIAEATVSTEWTEIYTNQNIEWSGKLRKAVFNIKTKSSVANFFVDDCDFSKDRIPTTPKCLTSIDKTTTTITLFWKPSKDDKDIIIYDIYMDNNLIASVERTSYSREETGDSMSDDLSCTKFNFDFIEYYIQHDYHISDPLKHGVSYTVRGLLPDETHEFYVQAKDATGNISHPSKAKSIKTEPFTDGEMLENRSFELGITPWFSESELEIVKKKGPKGPKKKNGPSDHHNPHDPHDFFHHERDKNACKSFNRTSANHGPVQDITEDLLACNQGEYYLKAWARTKRGRAEALITIRIVDDNGPHYYSVSATISSRWAKISELIAIDWRGILNEAQFIVHTKESLEALYVDCCSLKKKFNPDDIDNDGLSDAWELQYGDLTLLNGRNEDYDNDGISNWVEYMLGTDPTVPNEQGPGLYYEYDKVGRIKKIYRIPAR